MVFLIGQQTSIFYSLGKTVRVVANYLDVGANALKVTIVLSCVTEKRNLILRLNGAEMVMNQECAAQRC